MEHRADDAKLSQFLAITLSAYLVLANAPHACKRLPSSLMAFTDSRQHDIASCPTIIVVSDTPHDAVAFV